jgi:hypothetical protein
MLFKNTRDAIKNHLYNKMDLSVMIKWLESSRYILHGIQGLKTLYTDHNNLLN